MGRRSLSGGVRAKGRDRIEFTFVYEGNRYRPTLPRMPTEGNLRRARQQLMDIKARIDAGTFNFLEKFPDYKFKDEVKGSLKSTLSDGPGRTCDIAFKDFIAHCEMRVTMNDMAFSTLNGYRKILDAVWRPEIGNEDFEGIVYSRLSAIAAAHTKNKKTYNNIVSAVRCAFDY